MIRRLLAGLCALVIAATSVDAQSFRPTVAPGARASGFSFIGGGIGYPAAGSVADYDFKNNRYTGPTLTVVNSTGGYIDDSAGNWTFVLPNTLRRSDKGVLVEGSQTNSLRTSAIGSGGTPATWVTANPTGLTRSGTPQTRNGIDGILFTWTGTVTATSGINISFENGNNIAAASGQLWTSSFFIQVDTNTPGITFNNEVSERDSAGAQVSGALTSAGITLTGAVQRIANSRTLNGSTTAYVLSRLTGNTIAAGTTVTIAVWVGWPQLEQWSTSVTTVGMASSPIRTTGSAATRSADVISSTLPLGVLDATLIATAVMPPVAMIGGAALFNVRDGVGSMYDLRQNSTAASLIGLSFKAGQQSSAFPSTLVPPAGSRFGVAYAQTSATGEAAVSTNGSALTGSAITPNDKSPVVQMSSILIGSKSGGFNFWNGLIERVSMLPYRAANSNLQTYSSLSNYGN